MKIFKKLLGRSCGYLGCDAAKTNHMSYDSLSRMYGEFKHHTLDLSSRIKVSVDGIDVGDLDSFYNSAMYVARRDCMDLVMYNGKLISSDYSINTEFDCRFEKTLQLYTVTEVL